MNPNNMHSDVRLHPCFPVVCLSLELLQAGTGGIGLGGASTITIRRRKQSTVNNTIGGERGGSAMLSSTDDPCSLLVGLWVATIIKEVRKKG